MVLGALIKIPGVNGLTIIWYRERTSDREKCAHTFEVKCKSAIKIKIKSFLDKPFGTTGTSWEVWIKVAIAQVPVGFS